MVKETDISISTPKGKPNRIRRKVKVKSGVRILNTVEEACAFDTENNTSL